MITPTSAISTTAITVAIIITMTVTKIYLEYVLTENGCSITCFFFFEWMNTWFSEPLYEVRLWGKLDSERRLSYVGRPSFEAWDWDPALSAPTWVQFPLQPHLTPAGSRVSLFYYILHKNPAILKSVRKKKNIFRDSGQEDSWGVLALLKR